MNTDELKKIASYLLASPKGLLAADESNNSAQKRFDALGIPCTPETRRQYREMLLTTPNLEQYISGVIFYDETIRQSTSSGQLFTEYLSQKGIMNGIKVDKGLVDLTNFPTEKVTEGLDGLAERLADYYQMGARFTKWRAALSITDTTPSDAAIHISSMLMARYANLVQAAGMVPIVEPEVLYDGTHTLAQSETAIGKTLQVLFHMLAAYRVYLPGLILKTSMCLPGKDSGTTETPEAVAAATLRVLNQFVPKDTAGIVFLSGGQAPEQATANFNEIGKSANQNPWPVTFSFSRAVQDPAMSTWMGKSENISAAQSAFVARVMANAQARTGAYTPTQSS